MDALLDTVSGLFFGPGAFSAPKKTLSNYADPGLLDVFTPEEQDHLGEIIRKQNRVVGASSRPSFEQLQKFVMDAAKAKLARQQAAEDRAYLGAQFQDGMPGAMPQGVMPQGGMPDGMPGDMPGQMPQGSMAAPVPPLSAMQPGAMGAAPVAQIEMPAPPTQTPQRPGYNPKQNAAVYRRVGDRFYAQGRPDKGKEYHDRADKLDPPEEFGAPVAGVGADNQPTFFLPGKRGGVASVAAVKPPAAELPPDVRSLEYVTGQRLAGTGAAGVEQLGNYRRAGAPTQTVKVGGGRVGTIPEGLELSEAPDGSLRFKEIPGGPAERARREAERAEAARSGVVRDAAQTVFEDSSRALAVLSRFGNLAGGAGAVLDRLPAAPANELRGHIDSIKGNIAIDQLLKIKASGAGLGAIPQAQLEALAGMLGSLDRTTDPSVLTANLRRVKELYENIVRAEGGDPVAKAIERGFGNALGLPSSGQWTIRPAR
jgi:hypothetical protein